MQRLVALTQGLLLGRAGRLAGEGAAWWRVGLMLAGKPGAWSGS